MSGETNFSTSTIPLGPDQSVVLCGLWGVYIFLFCSALKYHTLYTRGRAESHGLLSEVMLLRTLLTPFSELSQSRILRREHCSVSDILSNSYCFNIQGCFCHIPLEKPWYSNLLYNHKAKIDRATKYFYSSARLCSKELDLCQSSEDSIHLLTKVNLSRAKCHAVVHDIQIGRASCRERVLRLV